jgi:hypothetical protein
MGDQLMKRVVADWGDLPGNSYKVLMVMAMTAMDKDEKPRYFGGWERLAVIALRRRSWPNHEDHSPEAEREREAGRKRVAEAVRDLIKAQAIKTKTPAVKQILRAEYWLTLDREIPDNRPEKLPETVQIPTGKRPENSRKPSHLGTHDYPHSSAEEPKSSLSGTSPRADECCDENGWLYPNLNRPCPEHHEARSA